MLMRNGSAVSEMQNYRDKVLGGWLGKNIGGTLGGPTEGNTGTMFYYFYDPVPTEPLPNDDFVLQMLWLDVLNKKGIYFIPRDIAYHWNNHMTAPIAEYFMGKRNMREGFLPPVSGAYNNWWINGMGCTIRSEIWAMIAPGMPDIAAAYAYFDATADHAQEGVYGEMFCAAIESAAFIESDPRKLIDIALNYIPRKCVIRDMVELVRAEAAKGTHFMRLRHLVLAEAAKNPRHSADFTYVVVNVGFIVLGLLTGSGYSEKLCNGVNCGYDTDCTGATLGALLGIIAGAKGIPEKWIAPVGNAVVLDTYVPGISCVGTIEELTGQVCGHGQNIMENQDAVRKHLYRWTQLEILKSKSPLIALPNPMRMELVWENGLGISVDYMDTPAIGHGEAKIIKVVLTNEDATAKDIALNLTAPTGFTLSGDTKVSVGPASIKEVPITIKTDSNAEIKPSNAVEISYAAPGLQGKTSFVLAGKACWLISDPISINATNKIESFETKGMLTAGEDGVRPLELATDDLIELLPEKDKIVFAQTDYFAENETPVRIVANNTGPLKAFLNGDVIFDKKHRSVGIVPTWHLQHVPLYFPLEMGFADVILKKGWNSIMLEIPGTGRPEDINMHLAQWITKHHEYNKEAKNPHPNAEPLQGITNTAWKK